ncbi:MAG: imidazoleglycerol-phosphate dehydratase HisB [Bacteroidetes bacterium]|nr:MAG: imidazoleglycerol-phosphate dehydratase HisB [Bacteroidota bacterium]
MNTTQATLPALKSRITELTRETRETRISLKLNLDGTGSNRIDTGIGFLDHLFDALAKHAGFDLDLSCKGDLQIDDHHTAEDCAIVFGNALNQCLGDKRGITRFGSAYAPLDEALARSVIDFSGRPFAFVDLKLRRDSVGGLACENIPHILSSIAASAMMTLHVDILRGENDHHNAEAAFKATALALRQAVSFTGSTDIPSTKGTLSGGPLE